MKAMGMLFVVLGGRNCKILLFRTETYISTTVYLPFEGYSFIMYDSFSNLEQLIWSVERP